MTQLSKTTSLKTGAALSGSIKGIQTVFSMSAIDSVRNILVIGCGGTGGHLIPNLSRFVHVLNSDTYKYGIKLFLADGDVVEEKNIIRQHFIHPDIGRNKAEVLAERYAAAFGLEIGVIPKYVEKSEDLFFLEKAKSSRVDLIISCVDNNASRKLIHEWIINRAAKNDSYSYGKASFWIDSGNEEKSGQVVCGYFPASYRYDVRKINPFSNSGVRTGMFSLPCSVEIYPELLKQDSFNSELSCAELAHSAPQNMQANVTAATIIMNFVQKILSKSPLNSHCVEFHIDNVFTTKLNTIENLKRVAENRRLHWEVCI